MKTLVEAAEHVVNELAILQAVTEVPESVRHGLEPGGVVDDGEIALGKAVELVEEVGDSGVAVAAEERVKRVPEGIRRVLVIGDDLQRRRSHCSVVPREDGKVIENPVGSRLGRRAVDVAGEAKLGEGGEELTAPEGVVFLLEIQSDQHMVADAKGLDLGGGEGLGGDGRTERSVVGLRVAGGGDRGGSAYGDRGGWGGERSSERCGS